MDEHKNKQIDVETIRHIAALSRIELDEEQTDSLARQFARILTYFDKLRELDTDSVQPLTHAVELQNVLAPDEPGPSLSPDEALANAPERDGNFFRVPKVLGDSS